ncbi:MAG TPA: ABC transporter permease, partial [Gemmatimonadaceae bacterium]|nr:ABC transporter permease [Gemmatimonadaceae bacterium]
MIQALGIRSNRVLSRARGVAPALAAALIRDIRAAGRSVARSPRHVALIAGCFALGLGANAAMFGVVDGLFIHPPPLVHDPAGIVRIYFERHLPTGDRRIMDVASFPSLQALSRNTTSFAGLAAYYPTVVSEGEGATARRLRVQLVSANYFELLGAHAVAGRAIGVGDARPGAPAVVVVSERLWQARGGTSHGGTAGSLMIAGRRYPIVGAIPSAFRGIDLEDVDAWLPLETTANDLILDDYLAQRGALAIRLIGRLKPGVAGARADADLSRAFRDFMLWNPRFNKTDSALTAPVFKSRGPAGSTDAKVAVWLGGLSLAVLLIACVNCAALLLLRTSRRCGELALRRAIGATSSAIAALVLCENLFALLIGAAAAVAVAIAATAALQNLLLPADASADVVQWWRIASYTFGLALLMGFAVSLPAIYVANHADVVLDLRVGARSGRVAGLRLRRTLLVLQVALTTVLLAGASLFLTSLRNVRSLDLGFRTAGVLLANIDFQGMGVRPNSAGVSGTLFTEIERSALGVPGVMGAGISTSVPFQSYFGAVFTVPGRDPALPVPPTGLIVADQGYQAAIGLRLVAGRWFERADDVPGHASAVINQTLAKALWPGESAVGKCLVEVDPPCRPIIGVVADTRRADIREVARGQLYLSRELDSADDRRMLRTLVVKTDGRPGLAKLLQKTIQHMSASLPYVTVEPLDDLIAPKRHAWELGAAMFTTFGALALVLASLGLYGTVSAMVRERSHELGVRLALGATRRHVARVVLTGTLVVVGVGLA